MLQLGKSKPWKEIMEMMTGIADMDTGAFREYFAPLEAWLIKHNKEMNNQVYTVIQIDIMSYILKTPKAKFLILRIFIALILKKYHVCKELRLFLEPISLKV
jgi:hypothetical protein